VKTLAVSLAAFLVVTSISVAFSGQNSARAYQSLATADMPIATHTATVTLTPTTSPTPTLFVPFDDPRFAYLPLIRRDPAEETPVPSRF